MVDSANSFGEIVLSGPNLVASQPSDQLRITAGDGITLTSIPDAPIKELVISATGGGGGGGGDPGPQGYTGSAGLVGKPSDSQKIVATGASTYTMNQLVQLPQHIFVMVNGLVLLPTTDYTVGGTNLFFASAPPTGSDIEIRYFDIVSPTGYQGSLGFRGSVGFTGSIGLGGTDGFSGSRGFTGSRGFSGSIGSLGYTGSKGEIGPSGGYTGSQGAGRPVAFQSLTSDGTAVYNIDRRVSNPIQILVMVNGLVQIPITDYTVGGATAIPFITFNTIPPNGSDIEILYFNEDPLVGFRGSSGFRGSLGFTGSAGAGGVDGYSGSRGFTGSIGIGFTGSTGFAGSTGAVGAPNYSQKIVSTGALNYSLDLPVSSPNHIIVSINGLVQMPVTDYQILGTSTLGFINAPIISSDIEIRYFTVANQVGFQGSAGAGFQGSRGQIGF